MELKRVVITGLGSITPIGNTVKDFWENLLAGKNGVERISYFDPSPYPVHIAAEVKDFKAEDYFERKELRKLDHFVRYAMVATRQAVADSGLNLNRENPDRIGVLVGAGIGGIGVIEEQHKVLLERGPRRVSPLLIPKMIPNIASGQIAIDLGLKGPNLTIVTACATGTHAIGDAFRIIQKGDADIMAAGGTEAAITPLGLAGFANMKAISERNDEPERASRPFDAQRDGFVMGEGAGVIILEELGHAVERRARIYAEIVGYGMSCDAYHITAPEPSGEGIRKCMQAALTDAGLKPEDINYINAHGTSTPLNDKTETQAIKDVFGQHAYTLKVSSNKSMVGHLLGAAGGVEGIATILTIYESWIPPTTNYEFPDPECDLDYVPNKAVQMEVEAALSNSMGFGGHNCTLVFKKFKDGQ